LFDKPEIDDEFMDAMEDLLEHATEQALKYGNDGERFIADFVQDARDGVFAFFEPLMDQGAEPHMIAQAAWPLALSIWNIMPLPCNNYRPLPIPMPKRNEPCRCGSGLKFKQCCARLGNAMHFPLDQNIMTKYLLEALPDARLKGVWERLPNPLLGYIAGEWVREDRDEAERALMMLNPILKQPDNKLNYRHEAVLDAMFDVCDELDKPRKKLALLKRFVEHPDKVLRAAALQRQCCMLSDRGDYDAAWQTFRKAQRTDPDNPGLSHLEVLILLQQGKIEQMKQRGRYWIKRLTQMDGEGYADLIALIRGMVDDPSAGMTTIMDWENSGAIRLIGWIHARTEEQAAPMHSLDVKGDITWIEPKNKASEQFLSQWRNVFPEVEFGEPDAWADAKVWLDFLDAHPQAAGHLSILDDIMLATGQLGAPNPAVAFAPLLDLALKHLQAILPKYPEAPIAWAALENRPALRTLATIIDMARESGETEKAQFLMEWMIRLNPNDNLEFRGPLTTLYLKRNAYDKALELCNHYPDDMDSEIVYGRGLALIGLNRMDEAVDAMAQAVRRLPKVAKAILKKSMKRPPDAREDGFVLGGDDQAWLYRHEARDLWVNVPGALDFLKQASRSSRGE